MGAPRNIWASGPGGRHREWVGHGDRQQAVRFEIDQASEALGREIRERGGAGRDTQGGSGEVNHGVVNLQA